MTEEKPRDIFTARELAICLSYYDLGVIHDIQEFARGSRRAPKVIVDCEKGKFLFKRRQKGMENLDKVAFTHQIQLSLAAQNFPLPHLLGTRDENNSLLVLEDSVYEMQEYIVGTGYDGSIEATTRAGHALGLYHKLLEGFESEYEPPTASYHNARVVYDSIFKAGEAIETRPQGESDIDAIIRYLGESYKRCAAKVKSIGIKQWPRQIVHGDWHPGNMLFRDQKVAAVIDYDTARLQQRVIDFANGALQFSIIGGGREPLDWPSYLDLDRFQAFLRGYDAVNVIATDEIRAMPLLMCEAMIAESILPVAATGSFGRFDGAEFLAMIRRKVDWILNHIPDMRGALDEPDEAVQAAPPASATEE